MDKLKAIVAAGLLVTGQAHAKNYIVAIPANMSEETQDQVSRFIGQLYLDMRPSEKLVVFDADHLRVVATVVMPDVIGTGKRDRIKVLGSAGGAIAEFIGNADPGAQVNDLNIPATLREIGKTVLPSLHSANVMMIGSAFWKNDHDATFSSSDSLLSDGWLLDAGGPFSIVGEERSLSGAIVSMCITDPPEAFVSSRFRQSALAFWSKSIQGRGGKVGAIQEMGSSCLARLESNDVDSTVYKIDRTEKLYITRRHWHPVEEK